MHHRTFLFFLPQRGPMLPVPQDQYVRLLAGALRFVEFANQWVRVADWYVKVRDDTRGTVINETYSTLLFDESGAVAETGRAASWQPSPEEMALLEQLLAVVRAGGTAGTSGGDVQVWP